jgi:hypothetical protein
MRRRWSAGTERAALKACREEKPRSWWKGLAAAWAGVSGSEREGMRMLLIGSSPAGFVASVD